MLKSRENLVEQKKPYRKITSRPQLLRIIFLDFLSLCAECCNHFMAILPYLQTQVGVLQLFLEIKGSIQLQEGIGVFVVLRAN